MKSKTEKHIAEILNDTVERVRLVSGVCYELAIIHPLPEKQFDAVNEMCRLWNYTKEQIRGNSRKWPLPTIRQILTGYLLQSGLKTVDVAHFIGFRNHSSVMRAAKEFENYYKNRDHLFMKYYNPVKHLFDEL